MGKINEKDEEMRASEKYVVLGGVVVWESESRTEAISLEK